MKKWVSIVFSLYLLVASSLSFAVAKQDVRVRDAAKEVLREAKVDKEVKVPYKKVDPHSSAGWKSLNVDDANHFFSKIADNYMNQASKFTIRGGDGVYRSLYQIEGSLRGRSGIFEWIVDGGGKLTHRVFIPGGKVTGMPNKF